MRLPCPKPGPVPSQPTFDLSALSTTAANFYRVSGTPDEFIIDFGIKSDFRTAEGFEAIRLEQRIVLNWTLAKRMAKDLPALVQLHEKVFGPIELDPAKRRRDKPPANQ